MNAVIVAEADVNQAVGQGEEVFAGHALHGLDVAVTDVIGQLEIGQPLEDFTEIFELVEILRTVFQRHGDALRLAMF